MFRPTRIHHPIHRPIHHPSDFQPPPATDSAAGSRSAKPEATRRPPAGSAAAVLAGRFERACRDRVAGPRVRVTPSVRGREVELRVEPEGSVGGDTLSVRGLDAGSWSDRAGINSLTEVVGLLLEVPLDSRR